MTRPLLSSLGNGNDKSCGRVEMKPKSEFRFSVNRLLLHSLNLVNRWYRDIACMYQSRLSGDGRNKTLFCPALLRFTSATGNEKCRRTSDRLSQFCSNKTRLPPRWYIAFNYIRYYERHPTWALQSKIEEFIPGVTALGEITSRDCRWLKKVSGAHEYSMNFEAAAETSRSRGRVHLKQILMQVTIYAQIKMFNSKASP